MVWRGALLALAAALLPACDHHSDSDPPPPPSPQPDFSLVDVNPSSPGYNASVSPRDHLTFVSGWYFGYAT